MPLSPPQGGKLLAWTADLLFSIYCASLAIALNGHIAGYSWAWRLHNLWSGRLAGPNHDPEALRYSVFLLVWLLAGSIFVAARMLARLPYPRIGQTIVGLVAVLAVPVAYFYLEEVNLYFLGVEAVIVLAGLLPYMFGRWRVSWSFTLVLITLHFGLWIWFASRTPLAFVLLWPEWDWILPSRHTTGSLHLLLGFCLTVLWALRVKHSRAHMSLPALRA